MAVNNAGFTAFVGLPGRTMPDFEACVETLVKSSGFPVLSKLISDRETAVYSDKFQKYIKDTYNVTIHFLEKGNKAFRVCCGGCWSCFVFNPVFILGRAWDLKFKNYFGHAVRDCE